MSNLIRINNKLMTKNNKLLTAAAYVPPTPQEEIIIPVSSVDEFGIIYDINDIPLNTPITFSYTDYSGSPSHLPLYLSYAMYVSNWSDYYASPNLAFTDKAVTFTITDKGNYTGFNIGIFKSNLSEHINYGNMSGYKLYYMA